MTLSVLEIRICSVLGKQLDDSGVTEQAGVVEGGETRRVDTGINQPAEFSLSCCTFAVPSVPPTRGSA